MVTEGSAEVIETKQGPATLSLIQGSGEVNWEKGFAFLYTGKMGLDFLGLGFQN